MYKIIQNSKVIDVVKHPTFVKFLPTGHIAITDKTSAQGIVGSDNCTIYSFNFIKNQNFEIVKIDEITSYVEFERLKSLLDSKQEISADESALEKAKNSKIKSLSAFCKNRITSGFSITLSDGESHNFKLTLEDQLNLMTIENQLANGDEIAIYHSTDAPCQVYTREDMLKIIRASKSYTLYHTTYFNAAKQYVKALTSIEQVNLFNYGMDVSDSVENPLLKQILKNGGGVY